MGERIDLGPFTFSVLSAARGNTWESPLDGTFREIVVRLQLHRDDSAPFTVDFHSFAEIEIVDEAGNRIPGSMGPVSPIYRAGRQRSTDYSCLFRYSRSQSGVRDFSAIGTRPQDFRFVIENPSPEADQARRISVQLR